MNLDYMARRGDANLIVDGGVTAVGVSVGGDVWRGVSLAAGSSIRLPSILRLFPFRAWPDTCGWYALLPEDGPDLEIILRPAGTDQTVGHRVLRAGSPGMVPVRLPWPARRDGDMDLILRAISGGGADAAIKLLSTRMLSRQGLLQQARGVGVEIGPGPQPQIKAADGVDVSYVEQMPPEEWNRLYNYDGRYPTWPELWDHYVVGDAANLPVAEGTLDFIFGSHVFEHLTNPLGHLKRWSRALRPGGSVLCVVPELSGAKDYFQLPSTLSEWERELADDLWEPGIAHYARFLRVAAHHPRVASAIGERFSIHVHYYTNTNTAEMLDYACRHLGFASWTLNWTPNHKDFHFTLTKP